jgi:hypothetical protein
MQVHNESMLRKKQQTMFNGRETVRREVKQLRLGPQNISAASVVISIGYGIATVV